MGGGKDFLEESMNLGRSSREESLNETSLSKCEGFLDKYKEFFKIM